MSNYISLQEAASFLGVSKATLRNWDKAGKLKAVRHPINQYRVYLLDDLQKIQARLPLGDDYSDSKIAEAGLDVRSTRTLIVKLHNILRDTDSHSNIIERFDELSKLLFLKFFTEEDPSTLNLLKRVSNENDKDYAARIRGAYTLAAQRNSDFISKNFSQLKANDAAICDCASTLSLVSFKKVDFDIKGLAYEEIIKNNFDKSDNQQFFTPPSVVRFMVEMMKPFMKGKICDPAAGTGGFLVEVVKSGVYFESLTALEIDERLAWVAAMNLYSHGVKNFETHWLKEGGSLGADAENYFGKFDSVITNPPFGSDFTDAKVLSRYKLGENKTSRRRGILFLERCYQLLKPDGTLAIIIDEGVLNLTSAQDVRRFLTDHFEIQAIVSLPETAFMPYATVTASILFLRKLRNKKNPNQVTFFARAENIGRKGNGDDDFLYSESGETKLNSDLPEILDQYRSQRLSDQCSSTELAYNANIFQNFKQEENGWRLDFRFHHPSREVSRNQLARAKTRLKPLGEICQERNSTLIPAKEMTDQTILYTGLAHIEVGSGVASQVPTPANSLKSAVKRYEPGDIIFAKMRPNLRKVALMDFKQGGYVSPECVVLRVKEHGSNYFIDPLLLSALLRSDLVYGQITHLIAGIGRPRISGGDLRKVLIPSVEWQSQENMRSRYLSEISASKHLREKATALLRDAANMEKDAVEQLAKEFAK